MNENLAKRDSNFIKGLKIREVQQLSELHKIIEVELPSDFARSSLSQQNLSRENSEANGAGHSTTFLKPKTDGSQDSGKKKGRVTKQSFLLSFLTSDSEAHVSLFLIDHKAKQVNTDICIVMAQSLTHLGTVQESEDEGDLSPNSKPRPEQVNTPNFETLGGPSQKG